MHGTSTMHEFVALEIPFPYSPLLSSLSEPNRYPHYPFTPVSLLCFSPQYTDGVYSGTLYHFKKLLFGISFVAAWVHHKLHMEGVGLG